MTLDLNQFDITSMKPRSACLVYGRRDTGKTFLVKDLLYHQNINVGFALVNNEHEAEFYSEFMPKEFIHEGFNTSVIKNMLNRQKTMIQRNRTQMPVNLPAYLVLDHCIYDTTLRDDENMRFLFLNHRCLCLMPIITFSYPLQLPSPYRYNANYIFILAENYIDNRRRLYDIYADKVVPTFELFCQLLDRYTENYGCLVINISSKKAELKDAVFWYRASEHDDFRSRIYF